MSVIRFLYFAFVCLIVFGILHIFFEDRFMKLKTILLIIGFISFLLAMFIFLLCFLHMF